MSARRPRRWAAGLIVAVMLAITVGGAAGQEAGMRVTVELQEFDDSGVTGTAVLTETGQGVQVSMVLIGADIAGNHPSHIHTGTCENFDPSPLYPLETVNLSPIDEEGMSETTVDDVELTELFDGEYVILVHQSPEELTKYLVCGEIGSGTAGTIATETPDDPPPTDHMPATGVGSSLGNEFPGSGVAFLFAMLAGILALIAGVLRRSAK